MKESEKRREEAMSGRCGKSLSLAAAVCLVLGGLTCAAQAQAQGSWTMKEPLPARPPWRILAPMKAGGGAVGVAVVDGKVPAIGGRSPDNNVTVATHEVYDPATNSWKDLAPLPKARDHAAATTAEGKIFFAGGR